MTMLDLHIGSHYNNITNVTIVSALEQVSPTLRAPLYQRCQAHLRGRIERGEFRVDAPLPTEEQLCRAYRVSRITVRRALSELIRLGLVSRRQGSGTFVTPPQPYAKSLSLVGPLDSVMALAPGITHELLGRRRVLLPASLARVFAVARVRVERLDLVYARGTPFAHTSVFIPLDVGASLIDGELAGREASIFHVIEARSPMPVARVDQRIEAVALPTAIGRALGIRTPRPVLRAQRAYISRDGRVMHTALVHYHPERFGIAMRFIP
jgi:GntR family transcriptional regulator